MPENVALTAIHSCGFELLSKQSYSPVQTFKGVTPWTGFWRQWSHHHTSCQWMNWRVLSKLLPWRCN